MTQKPALVKGQVWVPTDDTDAWPREIVDLTSEAVWWVIPGEPEREPWSWTAWRDWQQRHDARPVVETADG